MDNLNNRRGSATSSIPYSSLSQAASTHPMISDSGLNSATTTQTETAKPFLDKPQAPFASRRLSSRTTSETHLRSESSNVSLSVNYLPSKFSNNLLLHTGARQRKTGGSRLPKQGGGVDAFKGGEGRIPGQDDEDDDDGLFASKENGNGEAAVSARKLKWNRFKWILLAANILLTVYSLVSLVFCLLTWFDVWTHADVVRVGNRTELIISTFAASMGIFTSLMGWAGVLLNNRGFLATYSFLLWITFIFMLVPGYLTYKHRTFNLEGKVNAQWSRDLGAEGRARIQNQLECCGYFSPYVGATVTQTCYSRSILPGCKTKYIEFQEVVLMKWYTAAFSLVPFHVFVMLVGLLCSNHVTYRFGKGMMPKAYRLSMNSIAVFMDNYATQLAEQFGPDLANEAISRSRSQVNIEGMPTVPYGTASSSQYNSGYDLVTPRTPDTPNTPIP